LFLRSFQFIFSTSFYICLCFFIHSFVSTYFYFRFTFMYLVDNRCSYTFYYFVSFRRCFPYTTSIRMGFSAAPCRLAEIERSNVNNTGESLNIPYLEHIFLELPNSYLNRVIKSVSELPPYFGVSILGISFLVAPYYSSFPFSYCPLRQSKL
jgi:hypothetical protein